MLPIGKLIEGEAGRDAIHIAIAPMIAGEKLAPGQDVGLVGPGMVARSSSPLGIVDPFLKENVQKGERFYLFLYPNTITSLRHEWTHPALESQDVATSTPRTQSEAWLREFAEEIGVSYGTLMEAIAENLRTGDYYIFDYDTPEAVYTKTEQMWTHYEIVSGTKVAPEKRGSTVFSCAC